jgi:tetratricopeptide (TPR) repeat protein
MISCILAFYIVASAGPAAHEPARTAQSAPAAPDQPDPDALYARRDDLASARYWIGGHAPESERKAVLEAGIEAGRAAVRAEPNRPEGHFWIAANMGALAESFGLRQGLKYRGPVKDELLIVLKLDPAFQQGSADRALGRWYFKVPGLFGGSKSKSEEHLRRSLIYNPQSTASHFFLAETLREQGKRDEARAELQRVLDATPDPDWAPEDREFKQKARDLLAGKR